MVENKVKMITLRKATQSDGDSLAKIYQHYVENTAITFEYVAPTGEEFAQRIAHKTEKYPFIVAEEDGRPIGYAYASEYRERAAYSWDVETSVYVDVEHQGKGIGRRLYAALEEILKGQNVVNMYACITYPNPKSIRMHEAMGFRHAGKFCGAGFKMGKWHDVCWLEKRIGFPSEPQPVIPYPCLDEDIVNEILRNN
jgi:phosphinothricin acetyltransferase